MDKEPRLLSRIDQEPRLLSRIDQEPRLLNSMDQEPRLMTRLDHQPLAFRIKVNTQPFSSVCLNDPSFVENIILRPIVAESLKFVI